MALRARAAKAGTRIVLDGPAALPCGAAGAKSQRSRRFECRVEMVSAPAAARIRKALSSPWSMEAESARLSE